MSGREMDKPRIFISDWQVLFREGINVTLTSEDEFEVIGEATASEEILGFIEKNNPAIAILNADSGSPSGIDITRRIKQNQPGVGILLIMDTYNDEQLYSALKSGAAACLSKDMDKEELLSAVRRIARGENPVSQALLEPGIASRVTEEFEAYSALNEDTGNLLPRLLPVEEQVLQYIIHGDMPEEIARNIEITEEDVRKHLDIILSKLITNERSREVVEAVQSNLTNVISKISKSPKNKDMSADYITKEEFNAFKESLMERFKSLIGDLG